MAVKGTVFNKLTLGWGIQVRAFGSSIGYHFHKTDQLVEDFITKESRNCH